MSTTPSQSNWMKERLYSPQYKLKIGPMIWPLWASKIFKNILKVALKGYRKVCSPELGI